jgi:hypothetical protein
VLDYFFLSFFLSLATIHTTSELSFNLTSSLLAIPSTASRYIQTDDLEHDILQILLINKRKQRSRYRLHAVNIAPVLIYFINTTIALLAMANQAQHQRYIDTSSASSSLSASPNGELPLHPDHGTYGSTPIIQPVISRTLSNIPTPENNSLDPPRRRPSRLDSASGRLKEYHAAAAADENTVLAARGDPRNYAATITTTNRESIREDVRKTSDGWLGRFGAIELENKGSVARDHLALGE